MIPFFEFSAGAQAAPAETEDECKGFCDKQPACKSFSWSQKKKQCMWSVDSVQYDDEFTLYARSKGALSSVIWSAFPGVKFLTSSTVTDKHRRIGLEECKEICLQDPLCQSLSYRGINNFCATGHGEVSYNNAFKYFEKDEAAEVQDAQDATPEIKIEHDYGFEEAHEKKVAAHENTKDETEEARKQEILDELKKSMPTDDPVDSVDEHIETKVRKHIRAEAAQLAELAIHDHTEHHTDMMQLVEENKLEVLKAATANNAEAVVLENKRRGSDDAFEQISLEYAMAEADAIKLNSKIKLLHGDLTAAEVDAQTKLSLKTKVDKMGDAEVSSAITEAIAEAQKKVLDLKNDLDNMQKEHVALTKKVKTLKGEKEEDGKSLEESETAVAKHKAYSKVEIAAIEAKLDEVAVAEAEVSLAKARMVHVKAEEEIVKHEISSAEVAVFKQRHALQEQDHIAEAHLHDKTLTTLSDVKAAKHALGETAGKLYDDHSKNRELVKTIQEIAETLGENNELLHKAKEADEISREDSAYEQKVKTEEILEPE